MYQLMKFGDTALRDWALLAVVGARHLCRTLFRDLFGTKLERRCQFTTTPTTASVTNRVRKSKANLLLV